MTLTLILTRHAKSSWDESGQDDFDRPLSPRGITAAKAIGDWLHTQGHVPDEVILSGAARTLETWTRIAPKMPSETLMRSEPALYHATATTMLRVLHSASATNVMMIGHNPGICFFASELTTTPPEHPRFARYPTGATTIYQFHVRNWRDVTVGSGEVVDFVTPANWRERRG